MNKSFNFLFVFVLLALFASGCSRHLYMTYTVDPEGARLYEGERYLGIAPKTFDYTVSSAEVEAGSKTIRPITAKWPSGATAEMTATTFYFKNSFAQAYHFQRPKDYPDLNTDLQFAMEYLKQQSAPQGTYVDPSLYLMQGFANGMNQHNQQQPQRNHCTSNVVGSTVFTNCY